MAGTGASATEHQCPAGFRSRVRLMELTILLLQYGSEAAGDGVIVGWVPSHLSDYETESGIESLRKHVFI